jgi:hypothetical protein
LILLGLNREFPTRFQFAPCLDLAESETPRILGNLRSKPARSGAEQGLANRAGRQGRAELASIVVQDLTGRFR